MSWGIEDLVNKAVHFCPRSFQGTLETQEMLDSCSKHQIAADVEVISAADINEGFERLEQRDVHYRLVIDMATLKAPDGDKAKS